MWPFTIHPRGRNQVAPALFFVAWAVVQLGPARSVAQANDSVSKAREHFAAGSEFVETERFEEAHAEFLAGYRLSGRPLFLFNMGECAFYAGQVEIARGHYERYLNEDPQGSMADKAAERLASLPPQPAEPAESAASSPANANSKMALAPTPENVAATDQSTMTFGSGGSEPVDDTPAFFESWPFWAILGVVAIGATVAVVAVASSGSGGSGGSGIDCGDGCIDFRMNN